MFRRIGYIAGVVLGAATFYLLGYMEGEVDGAASEHIKVMDMTTSACENDGKFTWIDESFSCEPEGETYEYTVPGDELAIDA